MIFTLICSAVLFFGIFFDQITKALAAAYNVDIDFIPHFMRLDYTKNYGMAFSTFSDNPLAMKIVTVFTIVMIIGIAVLFFTVFKKNKPAQVALAVIEAGAIGNLIDRLCLGYVRDFADVSSIGFGNCNIADFFVTFGAVALLFTLLLIGKDAIFPLKKKWREQAKAEEEQKTEQSE